MILSQKLASAAKRLCFATLAKSGSDLVDCLFEEVHELFQL